MAQISVPGAAGTHLIFTVTGDSTTNYATAFANAVNTAAANGNLTLNVVNAAGTNAVGAIVLNELVQGSDTVFSPITGQYTVIDETASVVGSSLGHDSILAGNDINSSAFSATYTAVGSDNQVTFINGNNTYNGSVGTGSGDVITSGAGSDTINTGNGSSTVFSGTGTALINLNNTSGGDVVYLGDGTSTVVANGVNDTVAAAAPGQLIIGGMSGSSLTVAIETSAMDTSSGPAGDIIVARASQTTVFDSVGGNTIFGGTGNLTFVGQSATNHVVSDVILAGSGTSAIVGFANADITFASTSTSGAIVVVAGTGNETLNGANAGSFTVFGDYGDTTASASSSSTFVGSYDSTASDIFSTGAGNQSYVAGNAADLFQLDTVNATTGPANITIFGFDTAGPDMVSFGNDSANAQADLNSGTLSADGNLVLTLSDNTKVTFVGVTSLTGHTIT